VTAGDFADEHGGDIGVPIERIGADRGCSRTQVLREPAPLLARQHPWPRLAGAAQPGYGLRRSMRQPPGAAASRV